MVFPVLLLSCFRGTLGYPFFMILDFDYSVINAIFTIIFLEDD